MTAPQVIEQIDPRILLIDLNLPGRDKIDKDLAASIAALGVLEPIIGYRTADQQIRVRHGHRRTLAAIDAGLATVPVLVVADEATGTAAAIDRIVGQYHENTWRQGISPAQDAHVVAQLLDLGLSAAAIHRQTRMPKDKIRAARTVRSSGLARDALGSYDMTLDQAAALTSYEDDAEATQLLLDAAAKDPGAFWHQEQRLRDKRAEQQAIAAKRAELEASGITIADTWPSWEHHLAELAAPDGSRLTAEAHQSCPGNTAFLTAVDYGPEPVKVTYFCTDPKANAHPKFTQARSPRGGQSLTPEEQREQLRVTRENNKAWRSAAKVRCRFLRDFLTRNELPPDAMPVIVNALASGDARLRRSMERGHQACRDLLGIPHSKTKWGPDRVTPVLDAIGKAGRQRSLVITLGLVLAAYEDATYPEMWKSPGSHTDAASYFKLLASWGYPLSDIEQLIADAAVQESETAQTA